MAFQASTTQMHAVGSSPGALVYIGDQTGMDVTIRVMSYNATSVQEHVVSRIENCFPFLSDSTVTWIDIDAVQNINIIQQLGEGLSLHPLTLEDILNTKHRPKVEDFETYLYLVVKMVRYDQQGEEIRTEQLSLVLGNNYVISLQDGVAGDVFDPVRERIRSGKPRIRKSGADYLAYALVDTIIDNYFRVLEQLEDRIEFLDAEVVANPDSSILPMIYRAKRDVIALRKAAWPLREVASSLLHHESPLIKESTDKFLRDVYDHAIQVIDTVETFRDMLAAILDVYISGTSNKMNEVMKLLTMISTIFIPLTFIVGVEGMNIRHMPELHWPWTYPAIWFGMVVLAGVMIVYFKRRNWF